MYCSVNNITCCDDFNNLCCTSWFTLSPSSNVSIFNRYCLFLFSTLCCCSRFDTGKFFIISFSCISKKYFLFLGASFFRWFICNKCLCTTSSIGFLCHSTNMYALFFKLSSKKFHLVSVLYYYGMKRAAYRLSDPHFYQSSKWLQNLW